MSRASAAATLEGEAHPALDGIDMTASCRTCRVLNSLQVSPSIGRSGAIYACIAAEVQLMVRYEDYALNIASNRTFRVSYIVCDAMLVGSVIEDVAWHHCGA